MSSKIINVSAKAVADGSTFGLDPENTILIQIVDPSGWFPSANQFSARVQLQFDDIEEVCPTSIRQWQAQCIVSILQGAKAHNRDVVVHCVAGICRSGAVVEFALRHLDFELHRSPERIPNMLVLRELERVIGYSQQEELEAAFSSEGEPDVRIGDYYFNRTCMACPEQYDVYVGDRQVAYVRLRHGRLRVTVPDVGGREIYAYDFDNEYQGIFPSDEDRSYHFNKIVEVLDAL